MMKCIVCGNEKFELIHHGTRDNAEINVMRCLCCGGKQLSSFEQITDDFYENSGMHQNNEIGILSSQMVMADDFRRAELLKDDYKGKNLLDFGAGGGGFLRLARNYAESVTGVELEKASRERMEKDGINAVREIGDLSEKFEIITMFHVIEHLTEPVKILEQISAKLSGGGY